jgi:RNA-directed DNA polymerase
MSAPYTIDFTEPGNSDELAAYIGIDIDLFNNIISSNDPREFYLCHQIEKRGRRRGYRTVWQARTRDLSYAHKSLARRFDLFARLKSTEYPHDSAFGYIRHRGTRDNARLHCGAERLLRADIHNFFSSISFDRLLKIFINFQMQEIAAEALAKFVTIDGRLPLGLSASPMFANITCIQMDIKLARLANELGCRYTRYADDLAFSSSKSLPSKEQLQEILMQEGFSLADHKFRETKLGQAHYVTGLSISDAEMPHAPRAMKRRLRQELYYCKKFGLREHLHDCGDVFRVGVNRLDGTVKYVGYMEPRLSEKIYSEWISILAKDNLRPSYAPRVLPPRASMVCYVDETIIKFDGCDIIAICLVFTDDHDRVLASTLGVLREHRNSDPFYLGNKAALKKFGLHFVDCHLDLRSRYIKLLARSPISAYVVYCDLKVRKSYEDAYMLLLSRIINYQLMACDGRMLKLIFEQNSNVRKDKIFDMINIEYNLLKLIDSKRPIMEPEVIVGSKENYPCFALPDFMLGVFRRYCLYNIKNEKLREHQFESLRDKYRQIIDVDKNIEYSRRNPFVPWVPSSGAVQR